MRVGIVGSESAKFTAEGEANARARIRSLLQPEDTVVSGRCHLGGIDIWAEEEAQLLGCGLLVFPPAVHSWQDGYRPRNVQIAEHSDYVVCLTVDRFPPDYKGMKFPFCYHCKSDKHIKSGGCWTVKYARRIGIPGETIVVNQ